MKTYFLNRLKTLMGIQFFLVGMVFLLALLNPNGRVAAFGYYATMAWMTPIVFVQSSWLLTLPYSRHKLLLYHALESGIFALSSALSISVLYFVLTLFGALPKSSVDGLLAGLCLIAFTLPFRMLFVVNEAKLSAAGRGRKLTKGSLYPIIPVAIVGVTFLCLKRETWFIAAIALASIAVVPLISLVSVHLPKASFVKWRKLLLVAGAALYVCIALVSIVVIEFDFGQRAATDKALDFFGHIPLPISASRAHQLLSDETISLHPLTLALAREFKSSLSKDEWFHRAVRCKSAGCLNLTDELAPAAPTPEDQLNQFSALMMSCDLKFDGSHRLACEHEIKLSQSRLEKRLESFIANGDADIWLASDEPRKQAIAIRALSKTEGRQSRMKELLATSTDETVRVASERYLSGRAAKAHSLADLF